MTRYLISFSYIGTNFRGVQKELSNGALTDPKSIQGILELALQRFKPPHEPVVTLSSRTDQGVHALKTSAHVDLHKPPGAKTVFEPQWLLHGLNRTFEKAKADIRIQKIEIVPENFHARFSAKSRTYLYRFAVKKKNSNLSNSGGLGYGTAIPMSEWKRCYFIHHIKSDFDVSHVQEAADLFLGTHDFKTFMGRPKIQPEDKVTIRTILELKFREGKPLMPAEHDPLIEHYDFYEVLCKGRSFLYRQVRRIVGVLVAVAIGRLQVADVKRMIEVPSPDSWNPAAVVAPPHGLYLLEVDYDPQDLIVHQNALLEEKKRALKQTQTRITLTSGDVYVESRGVKGQSTLQKVEGCTTAGFVVDDKPDLQVCEVLPGLLVGSQDIATDSNLLSQLEITHILSVGVNVTPPLPHIIQSYIELLDLPESDISLTLEQGCTFIHSALNQRPSGKVFVHCNAGISRSTSLVIAYLIKYKKMNFHQALALVKKCRPAAKPNDGFMLQLQKFSDLHSKK